MLLDEGYKVRILDNLEPQTRRTGQPPVLYEDGAQTRDFCYIEDVARANLLAAESFRVP
ncbi:MAG: NAD-dependent epimerase/dehydratase family protein [Rubrobacteraceae bacterium]